MCLYHWKAAGATQLADQPQWAAALACGQLTIIAAGMHHTLLPAANSRAVAAQVPIKAAVAEFVPAVAAAPAAL